MRSELRYASRFLSLKGKQVRWAPKLASPHAGPCRRRRPAKAHLLPQAGNKELILALAGSTLRTTLRASPWRKNAPRSAGKGNVRTAASTQDRIMQVCVMMSGVRLPQLKYEGGGWFTTTPQPPPREIQEEQLRNIQHPLRRREKNQLFELISAAAARKKRRRTVTSLIKAY